MKRWMCTGSIACQQSRVARLRAWSQNAKLDGRIQPELRMDHLLRARSKILNNRAGAEDGMVGEMLTSINFTISSV